MSKKPHPSPGSSREPPRVRFWKRRTGHYPDELIFDSKLTTYAKLDTLNSLGIDFITLRRRSAKILDEIRRTPPSAWRRIELEGVSRTFKHPRVLDRRITLRDYDGPLRQLTVTDLGHDEPTLILTNQLTRPAAKLIGRYARRMIPSETGTGRRPEGNMTMEQLGPMAAPRLRVVETPEPISSGRRIHCRWGLYC
jgi:hypothetical protein